MTLNKSRNNVSVILGDYLGNMKSSIVALYARDQKPMSDIARVDLESKTVDQVFSLLPADKLKEWVKINADLNIGTLDDFVNWQTRLKSALTTGSNPKMLKQINSLTPEDRQALAFCSRTWSAVQGAFIGLIENTETIRLLLKYNEQIKLFDNASVADPHAPNASGYDEESSALNALLRRRLKDIEGEQIGMMGVEIANTLMTTISPEEWSQVLAKLAREKYIDEEYLRNPLFVQDWMFFALSFKYQTAARSLFSNKLIWRGTIIALAEFLLGMIKVSALEFSDKNKEFLYSWIDRTIDYSGKRSSLVTNLSSPELNSDCFVIARKGDGSFFFSINYPARKPKGR